MAQVNHAYHNAHGNVLMLDTILDPYQLFLNKKQAKFLEANLLQQNLQPYRHILPREEHLNHHVAPLNRVRQSFRITQLL